MRRALVVSCALAVMLGLLGACGDEKPTPIRTIEPRQTASSPSPVPETKKNNQGCKLLTSGERKSIAGQPLTVVSPLPVIKGALQCRWVVSLASPVTTSLKVVSQPLQVWLKALPGHIDRLTLAGLTDPKFTGRLQDMKKAIIRAPEDISDKQACKYFSLLVEISQGKKELREGILFQGTQSGDYKVTWQKCGGGVHTELNYEEPKLQVSLALAQAVIRLGKTTHKRAVARLT